MAGEVRIGGNTASVNLQGNDSITSNQTFTFPDEGGELIVNAGSAITVTPGSKWSGTVSQNGAGAAMETGSNADGETWIKFADGTMLIKTKQYVGNVGGGEIDIYSPQPFVDTNWTYFWTQTISHNDDRYGMSLCWGKFEMTTSFVKVKTKGFTDGDSATGFTFLLIGRWY